MLLYNQFYLDLQDECLLGVKILYEAFALTGRIVDCECTQGAALGWGASALYLSATRRRPLVQGVLLI